MSNSFVYPKPRSWEDFEDIVADLYRRKYAQPNLQRYGRLGQKQYGIDIVGHNHNQNLVGIQCKHHTSPAQKIHVDEVKQEVRKAESFTPQINLLIIATSASRDTEVHSDILSLHQERTARGDFGVEIVFWEHIIDTLSDYPDLLYKHIAKHFPLRDTEHIPFDTKQLRRNPCVSQ